MKAKKRSEIPQSDQWDLSSLFKDEKAWEEGLAELKGLVAQAPAYKQKMQEGRDGLLATLAWYGRIGILSERIGCWAMLRYSGDASDPADIRAYGLASQALTEESAALSFFDPQLLAIDDATFASYLADPAFKDYRIFLEKSRRFKEHVLGEKEERILALQGQCAQTPDLAFSDLTNVDMDFGQVDGRPLTQSTYNLFMQDRDRSIRKQAYDRLYATFEAHEHVLARLYEGSVQQDIFSARVRGYASSRDMALFPDHVDGKVYDTLVRTVHEGFPLLHRFYALKRRVLKLDKLGHWDVYVPLVDGFTFHTTYDQAVDTVCKAASPLGASYVDTLRHGLTDERWVDRYENQGKRSGAFSSGCYTSKPYILLNFTGSSLNDLFTMIHEGGHSMHSYYSKQANPFFQYDYTIFEAEVASTTNEQLLARYLIEHAPDERTKAAVIGKQLDDIVATLFRQTMFAEFEDQAHKLVEQGETLSVDAIRSLYRKLLEAYFGPDVEFTPQSDLEGLRIPHFYNAYYVYKYATGISAAIALSGRILSEGEPARERYLAFLHSGGSRWPMDSLRLAGVDMEKPDAIEAAISRFGSLLEAFEKMV